MVNSESIPDGFSPKHPSRSSLPDSPTDRSHFDLNHSTKDLTDQLKNVDLDDNSKAVEIEIESEGENESEKREALYPVRPDAEDCSFFMRYGSCKYGSTCKFNHPLSRKIQIGREKVSEKEEDDSDEMRLMDCKYYFRTGGCKYGETCRFNHTKAKPFYQTPLQPELNFLGLPLRPGEIECPYYMRNGNCKYGAECKFNHPDPSTIGGTDSPSFRGNNNGTFSPKSNFQASSTSWNNNSPRHLNGTSPFIPVMMSSQQTRGVSSQTPEWNGYQGSSERNVFSPSNAYRMNNPSAEMSRFSQYQFQMPPEEFPERPDQPECGYYLKTGDCKFKFSCKFHHPKNRLPKQPPSALNDKGLPLRPGEEVCTHYSRYGICKYGPACRFDHSAQPTYSTGSPQAVVEPTHAEGNGNDFDGWN